MQEALTRAWRGRTTCRSPEAALPWLLAITRREALRWRAKARHAREEVVEDPERAGPIHAPLDPLARLVDRLTVRQAIAGLSHDEQRLLGLRYERDLSQPEIAERLGIPEGTVKIRLHRLRMRLSSELR